MLEDLSDALALALAATVALRLALVPRILRDRLALRLHLYRILLVLLQRRRKARRRRSTRANS